MYLAHIDHHGALKYRALRYGKVIVTQFCTYSTYMVNWEGREWGFQFDRTLSSVWGAWSLVGGVAIHAS
jgi:hypothetical protein